jgi:IMP dehydrogenase
MEAPASQVFFTVADVMAATTQSVTSRDTVATAAKRMSEHSLPALPVLEQGRVLGLVTALQLLVAPAYRPVVNVMTPGITPATPDLPLAQAYASMMRQRVEVLPVVQGDHVVGQITASAILRKQSQQNDPLTGLPASTALRAWAMAALERGQEISILFVDLDNFGAVNKLLGHVAGDDLLRALAQLMARYVDERTDLLSRYGGDEFVIATTRQKQDARRLMDELQEHMILPVDAGETARTVTASIGMAGGRRAERRERTHIAATVDDLLTIASRASTLVKETKRAAEYALRTAGVHQDVGPGLPAPAARVRGGARLQLIAVNEQADVRGGTAAVTLRLGTRDAVGHASGSVHGRGLMFLVAQATLDAVRQSAGDLHSYVVEELNEVPTAVGRLVVAVLSATSNGGAHLVGSARAPDLAQAVTKAILDAVNRRLSRTGGTSPGNNPETGR